MRSEVWPLINDLCSLCAHFRIVRNKAAEKVKEIGGYESSSPGPLSGSLASDTSLPLRHPSYSINNILGVQQTPDANENILKRKREDDGRQRRNCFYFHFGLSFLTDENQDASSQLEPAVFKRARSQYSSAYNNSSMVSSMWAAGKWMAANQSIKQEKGSGSGGGMMAEENTATTTSNVSPVNSPSYPASFPDNLPFSYDGATNTNMSSMASNAYTASLNSSSGEIDGSKLPAQRVKYVSS